METSETRKGCFHSSFNPPMSSNQKQSHDPGTIFPNVMYTKRRKKALDIFVIPPVVWILLLYTFGSTSSTSMALANPVEEDPQNYGARANDGMSFSINSPRKSDRNREKESRANQKMSPLDADRKGIKVFQI